MIEIIGKTTDNKFVVSGVFKFVETYGFPLEDLLYELQQRNYMPSWPEYVREGLTAGMAFDRLISRLEPAISEVYGVAFCDKVIQLLRNKNNGR